jgi:hypothetical protein
MFPPTGTYTSTPTPTPVTPPPPTATFPVITPMTAIPLKGIQLSGKVYYYSNAFYDDSNESFNLGDYHFDKPIEIRMTKDYFLPKLYHGAWSADNQYLARPADLQPIIKSIYNHQDLGICIIDANGDLYKCIRIYNVVRPTTLSLTSGDHIQIQTITWSPNNKYLLVTIQGEYESDYVKFSPCVIEISTSSVDCRWMSIFSINDYDAYKAVAGAYAISWSPKEENKLAIPLKRNWWPVSVGIENGDSFDGHRWDDISTDDLKQGLYLVDTAPLLQGLTYHPPAADPILTLLWESPPSTTMDPEQLPLWTSDGKQIAFVYLYPWFNVERKNSRHLANANYAVGIIGENGQDFQKLFDSTSMYLSGVLPLGSSLPAIQIHRWLYQDRFLIFTAQIYLGSEDKYKQSLFLYDTETKQFFQVTNWNKFGN